jgi:hypothetical protein
VVESSKTVEIMETFATLFSWQCPPKVHPTTYTLIVAKATIRNPELDLAFDNHRRRFWT